MQLRFLRPLLLILTLSFAGLAQAQSEVTVPSVDNATVRPDGPRPGSFGRIFFNVEGSANGSFASFGVVDFDLSEAGLGGGIETLRGLRLRLTQSNAGFTGDGDFSVYWTDAVDVDTQEGAPIAYQSGQDGIASVDPAFTDLRLLGSARFIETSTGVIDSFPLDDIDAAETALILDALNAGSNLRLIITPDEPATAATWAGQDNFDGPSPELILELAPTVFINEIHYDNVGADAGEFVELAGNVGTDLTGWTLALYNGSSQSLYDTVPVNGQLLGDGNPASAGLGFLEVLTPGLQNGAPDGLALVDPNGDVVQFLGYEGSFTAADGPAAGLTSDDIGVAESPAPQIGFSLQLTGNLLMQMQESCVLPGIDQLMFTWTGPIEETRGTTNSGQFCGMGQDGATERAIFEIQGAAHRSPFEGDTVRTRGVVTSVGRFDAVGSTSDVDGFFLQDPDGDGDLATSDAIFVLSQQPVNVGDELSVSGLVQEATARSRELSYTRLQATAVSLIAPNQPLPAPQLIGAAGRVAPSETIDDDAFGTIPGLGDFDPQSDGADFFESLEAMRVEIAQPLAISNTNRFGEIFVVADDGATATGISSRGTLTISPDDFNPEKIQLDPGLEFVDFFDAGSAFEAVVGVVAYDFGNFQVQPETDLILRQASTLEPESTVLLGAPGLLTIASYNVLNLEPNDGDGDTDVANGRFDAVGRDIVEGLGSPDIVGLQEIQDNSGSVNDGIVAADLTLQTLVDAIAAAGGPDYAFIDNTFITNNNSGGQPGGNIRTAFLYNPARVELVAGSVRTVDDLAAFQGARLPLIASFLFESEAVTVVVNHFSSKGGSAPIVGVEQPFEARQEEVAVNGSLDERTVQATAVRQFVDEALAADEQLIVLGDFNEFEFISPVENILGDVLVNLLLTVPAGERYTFQFQGNSQALDHILVAPQLAASAEFDIVHRNAEFAETPQRASDHEPLVARFSFDTCGPIEGGVTAPSEGACFGPDMLPVTVLDDFTSTCGEVEVEYSPSPGPNYSEHGDYDVRLFAIDDGGNETEQRVRFTIDTIAPTVRIDIPEGPFFEQGLPLAGLFGSSDDDDASGGVVRERIRLGDCVLLDGTTFGDQDGLLADEAATFTLANIADVVRACIADGVQVGPRRNPVLTLEAFDCGGNVGSAAYALSPTRPHVEQEPASSVDGTATNGATHFGRR